VANILNLFRNRASLLANTFGVGFIDWLDFYIRWANWTIRWACLVPNVDQLPFGLAIVKLYQISGLSINCAANKRAIVKREHAIQVGGGQVEMGRRMLLRIDVDFQAVDAIDQNTAIKKKPASVWFEPDMTTRI
jgi:hypothetical protein